MEHEILALLGYASAVVIGITLGLLGAGGSILSIPVMVYLMGISPVSATSYSLFIVGFSSLIGSAKYYRQGLVNFNLVALFGIPSLLTVFIIRKFIMPSLPEILYQGASFILTKDLAIMLLFSVLMMIASISMIRSYKTLHTINVEEGRIRYLPTIVQGVIVGFFSGIVGAGGGFLIIPALVILCRQPIKMAIGTSLLIISINSCIAFGSDLNNHVHFDWRFLFLFTGIAIVGIIIGNWLNTRISSEKLRPAFGWFVLGMGLCIGLKELL
jgi:uncharacterized membrane protein YfcA